MNSHIEIKIFSINTALSGLEPTGIAITYGVNMIPYAVIDLPPTQAKMLCDFDQEIRREPVSIRVRTSFGCLVFDGLADGLSSSASPGSTTLQLIVKSAFQELLETFPRSPGMHPNPLIDILFRRPTFEIKNYTVTDWLHTVTAKAHAGLNENQPPSRYIINAGIAILEQQENIRTQYQAIMGPGTKPIMDVIESYTKVKFDRAIALLRKVDTSYVDETIGLTVKDSRISQLITPCLIENTGSVFDFLIQAFSRFGCNLVVGSRGNAYVIPNAGFVKIPHIESKKIVQGTLSPSANIFYPMDYESYDFSDAGYKDVKAVYVISDPASQMHSSNDSPDLGRYVDPNPNTTGGILVASIPQAIAYNLGAVLGENTKKSQRAVAEQTPNLNPTLTQTDIETHQKQQKLKIHTDTWKLKQGFFDQWAELKYLEVKYMDRTGSVMGMFNPNRAPGAVGVIYTRLPGIAIDMLITSVTHRFQVSPPNGGQAVTSVAFNCGRFSKSGSGVDEISLFKYTGQKSLDFATKFAKDINEK